MSEFETIKVEQTGEIVTVYLNRPRLNLFNNQMIEDLISAWHGLRGNREARFVVLTHTGDHFSAGADLGAIREQAFTPEDARYQQLAGHELMRSLESLEQVTVFSGRGVICGAGMAVAMACDFRIMTEKAYYIVPESQIGTYYTWGCTPRLVRMVGASRAMEIIMLCDPISSEDAFRLNLANRVVPEDQIEEATRDFIAKIASKSPTCIRLTKKIALGASMEGFGNMFICEPELMQGVVYTGETDEGIAAFLEKRQANFPK
ncbi:MAG: enoyl-CoA hydratase/isomerase family protein [Proteobacteria bacterium]|nr:enoyl-CoA hydratase/isomerase family protein [Pseudomonadota bacterium]